MTVAPALWVTTLNDERLYLLGLQPELLLPLKRSLRQLPTSFAAFQYPWVSRS